MIPYKETLKNHKLSSYGLHDPLKELYTMNEEKKKPEKNVRAGNVTATVWKNEVTKNDKTFDVLSVKLQKSYPKEKNDDGTVKTWENMNVSLSGEEVTKAIEVLKEARLKLIDLKIDQL